MQHNYLLRYCLLVAVSVLSFSTSRAATITVTSTDDDGMGTLRNAVRMAMAGDTIYFAASTDGQPIQLGLTINIEKDLTIIGNGMMTTGLDGTGDQRPIAVRKGATVMLKDLAIFNGVEQIGGGLRIRANSTLTLDGVWVYDNIAEGPRATQGGGAIFNEGMLTIMNSVLEDNAATGAAGSGGAIYNGTDAMLTITGSRIDGNEANRAGGGIEDVSGASTTVMVTDTRINKNVVNDAPGNGGGVHVGSDGNFMITGGTVDLNEAGQDGGGLWNGEGTMTVSGTLVRFNVAKGIDVGDGGGGLYNKGLGTMVLMDNARVLENKATGTSGSGGGILNNVGATLTVMDSRIEGNEANRAGGGIEDASGAGTLVSITNTEIVSNIVNTAPGNGGGVHVGSDGDLTMVGGRVDLNEAGREGGGLWNGAGTMTLDGVLVRYNIGKGDEANQGGGGLHNIGMGTIILKNKTRVLNNKATGMAGSGGGILNLNGATLRIMDSEVSRNEANRAGGGIEDASGSEGEVVLMNSNLKGNVVNNAPGNGGGLHVTGAGDVSITNGVVDGNMAGREGGGLWNGSGTMTVTGTEITNNVGMGDEANQGGGGLHNIGGGTIILEDAMVSDNKATGAAGSGGGILNLDGATLIISDSRIERNEANRAGGGIEDASGSGSLVTITNTRINRNVVGTAPGNGGGVHITGDGDMMITGGTVDLNEAGREGGGLWNGAGTMTVSGTLIRQNVALGDEANQGGGGLFNNGGGTIVLKENVRVLDNKATGTSASGGGILNNVGASLEIMNSRIAGNEANRAGGGIEDVSGAGTDFTVSSSVIQSNVVFDAPGNGGGIHITGDGDLMIDNSFVLDNVAGSEGGGIWNSIGTTTVTKTLLQDNVAMGDGADNGGGGLFNNGGTLIVNNSRLSRNQATGTAGSGGGLLSTDGMVTINGGRFENNTANRAGGGVEIIDGSYASTDVVYNSNDAGSNPGNGGAFHITGMMSTVDFTGGEVSYNVAANEGGGLWNQIGTMMNVSGVSILYNQVTDKGDLESRVAGAGVFNNGGIIDIETSTIAFNQMLGEIVAGGGIANNTGGTITLMQSTVSNNFGGGAGGGIANDGEMEIVNSTIAQNTAILGGGYAQATHAATLTVSGSVFALNEALFVPDFGTVLGTVNSEGFNFVGIDLLDQFPATATDKENMDAMLMELMDNGGMTLTHMPACGSPLIDMGDPNDQSADQTGAMVFGGRRDIGSTERQSACGGPAIAAAPASSANSLTATETLSVFPNPTANDFLIVRLPDHFSGDVALRITDMQGRVRNAGTVQVAQHRLDLTNFTPGTYTLQAINGEEVESIRFVVAR